MEGDLLNTYNLGNPEGSLEGYRKALAAQEQRARLLPGDWEAQRRVEDARISFAAQLRMMRRNEQSNSLMRQADASLSALYKTAGQEKILETLARARYFTDLRGFLAITERLLARHPDDPRFLRNLALAYKTLGSEPKVPVSERLIHAKRALELDQRRLNLAPQDASIGLEVSLSASVLGTAYVAAGMHREALSVFEEMVALRRDLARKDPENVKLTERLAVGLNILGWHFHQLQDWEQAWSAFAEARRLIPGLQGRIPTHIVEQIDSEAELGIALQPDGDRAIVCQAAVKGTALIERARKAGMPKPAPLHMILLEVRKVAPKCPPAS